MPTYIVKVIHPDDGRELFAEWSTIVDAPVSLFMELEEFKSHYLTLYGTEGMHGLPRRLERVYQTGSSARHIEESGYELLSCNRAGENEREMGVSELIRDYSIRDGGESACQST